MITSEIIQRIQSLYSKGVQSDDSRLTSRHIYSKMITLRSKLLTQKLKKKQKISEWNYSYLRCVEVIEVEAHACPCLPQIGCKVYRTKFPLPKPLTDYNKELISWVMSIENSTKFSVTTRDKELYVQGQRFTSKKKRYLTEDKHIYFYGGFPGDAVAIKMLPEDPIEAANYVGLCDTTETTTSCLSPLDQEFPIDDDLIEDLITMSVPELISAFNQTREDISNNTRDNIVEETK